MRRRSREKISGIRGGKMRQKSEIKRVKDSPAKVER
jgi:hypothetical protein